MDDVKNLIENPYYQTFVCQRQSGKAIPVLNEFNTDLKCLPCSICPREPNREWSRLDCAFKGINRLYGNLVKTPCICKDPWPPAIICQFPKRCSVSDTRIMKQNACKKRPTNKKGGSSTHIDSGYKSGKTSPKVGKNKVNGTGQGGAKKIKSPKKLGKAEPGSKVEPGSKAEPTGSKAEPGSKAGPGSKAEPGSKAGPGSKEEPTGSKAESGSKAGPGSKAEPGSKAGPGSKAEPGSKASPVSKDVPGSKEGNANDTGNMDGVLGTAVNLIEKNQGKTAGEDGKHKGPGSKKLPPKKGGNKAQSGAKPGSTDKPDSTNKEIDPNVTGAGTSKKGEPGSKGSSPKKTGNPNKNSNPNKVVAVVGDPDAIVAGTTVLPDGTIIANDDYLVHQTLVNSGILTLTPLQERDGHYFFNFKIANPKPNPDLNLDINLQDSLFEGKNKLTTEIRYRLEHTFIE